MLHRALKLARQYHRLSQSELAEKLQISKSFLSEIESGKKSPTLDLIDRYSRHFHIPASTLVLIGERLNGAPKQLPARRADQLLRFLEWAVSDDEDEDHAAA